jgi:hypothetical protein
MGTSPERVRTWFAQDCGRPSSPPVPLRVTARLPLLLSSWRSRHNLGLRTSQVRPPSVVLTSAVEASDRLQVTSVQVEATAQPVPASTKLSWAADHSVCLSSVQVSPPSAVRYSRLLELPSWSQRSSQPTLGFKNWTPRMSEPSGSELMAQVLP